MESINRDWLIAIDRKRVATTAKGGKKRLNNLGPPTDSAQERERNMMYGEPYGISLRSHDVGWESFWNEQICILQSRRLRTLSFKTYIYRLTVAALPFSVSTTTPIFGNCTPPWEYREHGTLCIRFTYKLFIFSCFSHRITACTTGSDENFMRIYHVLGWYSVKITFFLFPSSCASHCLFFYLSLLPFVESELFKVMFQIYPR